MYLKIYKMKKIYLSISAITFSLSSIAQQSFTEQASGISVKHPHQAKTRTFAPVKNQKISAVSSPTVAFQGRFDPSYALPAAHGANMATSGGDYTIYVDPVYVDTTTISSFSSGNYLNDNNMAGMTFDPKSIIYDLITYNPLLTAVDSYYLDTVWVGGVYQRRGNNLNDTLIVDIVWGDTATTATYGNWSYSIANPNLNAMGPWSTPKYSTVANQEGDRIRFTSPTGIRIVHVLTKADSTYLADVSDYLPIVLNGAAGQLIPANNIVSAGISFNACQPHANGAVSYAPSTALLPGTVSGYALLQWSQTTPAINTIADVNDFYNDLTGSKNSTFNIYKRGRYGLEAGAFINSCRAGFYYGYWIDFSIHYTPSTVGVNELEKNGFVLGQNMPNPSTNGSIVNFQLAKDASSSIFTVSDVTGRIVSSEKVATTAGAHSVKLGAYAAGVYYYSLNVDGNVTTKKMIAQ
jgi:hypothetical protein